MKQVEEYCVYRICSDIDDRVYVGITKNPQGRWKDHLKTAFSSTWKSNFHKSKLSNSMRKYGKEKFSMEILLYGDKDYCGLMEQRLIEAFDSFHNGYNQSPGGEGTIHYKSWKTSMGMSYTPGIESQRKLFPNDKLRLIDEAKAGIPLEDMKWLPIKPQYAYQVLKEEGITAFNRRWIPEEDKRRLIEEIKQGISIPEILKWWPYDKSMAYEIPKKEGILIPRLKRKMQLNDILEIGDKYYYQKISFDKLMIEYNLSFDRFHHHLRKFREIRDKKEENFGTTA